VGGDPAASGLIVSRTRGALPDRLPPLPLPDLSGRRAIVTGATSGIGLATATALAGAGAQVVLAVRNPGKGEASAAAIRTADPDASVVVEELELGSLDSIARFAARAGVRPVDLLVNNAGTSASDPRARTADGFDLQVGVNYLGAWALTAGLWPALAAAAGRVVMLGSTMATRGRIGPGFGEPGSTYRSYCDSKLAAVVLAGELRRHSHRSDAGVTAVAAHPGWCRTAIFDTAGPPPWVFAIGGLLGAMQSPADGAQPVLLAATDPRPGAYYGPRRFGGSSGPAGPVPLPRSALVPGAGEQLWQLSGQLTGVTFGP
jgi:NAD(P)-dependent dehydrogenase (short-subunit alcohol dehydrogenase family)